MIQKLYTCDECKTATATAPEISTGLKVDGWHRLTITPLHPDSMRRLSIEICPKCFETGHKEFVNNVQK